MLEAAAASRAEHFAGCADAKIQIPSPLQVEEALRLHTADNISVITICFGDEPPPRRIFGGRPHGMPGRSLSQQGLGTLSTALSSALE